MYSRFYTFSTTCELRGEAPKSRGIGLKTYLYFSRSKDKETREASLCAIPDYERILDVRVYKNHYPLDDKHTPSEISLMFSECRRCNLANHRQTTVHHRGSVDADVVFVGQSPGLSEDAAGMPFVGKSGKMHDDMLAEVGFTDKHLITNVVACTPTNEADAVRRDDPKREECIACSTRLWLLLRAVKPKIVIALGLVAADMFWQKPKRYQRFRLYRSPSGIYFGMTRHPAYLLRKMQKGGMYEYEECIRFLKKVNSFIPEVKDPDNWYMLEGPFPFAFIDKEIK